MGAKQHRHEQDLGLIDAGGRFYDPLFGVFLSADPISPLGGSSPRMNRYAYVGYDPVNFVDPSGLFLEDVWNKVTNFAGQVWGNVYVAPINLVLTGRWQTSWDTDTTEALITALAATAAGLACGAASAGNLAIAGACAGAVGGGGGALSSGGSGGDVFFAASIGALFGTYGGAAGMFANNAVYASTQSHIAASLSAAGATSGMSVGLQLVTGQDVNWAQVAANGVVSGLLAWHKGAQLEAQSEATGTAAGGAAATASRNVAGWTRTNSESLLLVLEAERAAGYNTILSHRFGGVEVTIGLDDKGDVTALGVELTGRGGEPTRVGPALIHAGTWSSVEQVPGGGIKVSVGPLPIIIPDAKGPLDIYISGVEFSSTGNVVNVDAGATFIPNSMVQDHLSVRIGNQAGAVSVANYVLDLSVPDVKLLLEATFGPQTR